MTARILPPTPDGIDAAARELRAGRVVGMPTETVYGLAGDVFRVEALGRIYDAKERPKFDPLIAHVAPQPGETPSLAWLERQRLVDAAALPLSARDGAERLLRAFWPGPLTIVLPKTTAVPDLATSGLPTVGVRMPAHPVAQALIRAAGVPLAAPSANRFGRISPTSAEAVLEELGDRIDVILDGGPCAVGLESTIVAPEEARGGGDSGGGWRLLRPGGTPAEDIERVLGAPLRRQTDAARPEAPGQLESHYAPGKTLRVLPTSMSALGDADLADVVRGHVRVGLLLMRRYDAASARLARLGVAADVVILSATGDHTEAAAALFAGLRHLDHSAATLLLAEPPTSDRGLGYALADRLRRASTAKPSAPR